MVKREYLLAVAALVVVIAIFAAMGMGSGGRKISPEEMQVPGVSGEIARANYCSVDSDCVDIGPSCPAGCVIPVNKREEARMRAVVAADASCVYTCSPPGGSLKCIAGKCGYA